jgi:DNA-binding transcriptional LysR family regulator
MLGFCLKCDSPRHFWESLHPSKGGNPCLRTVAKNLHGRLRGLPLGQNGSPLPLFPIRSRSSLVFEHNYQALQAALDGLGVAIASSALIADEVASERLAIPFAEPKLPGEGYTLMSPKETSTTARLLHFAIG